MLAKMKSGGLRTLFCEVLSLSATAWLLASSWLLGAADARARRLLLAIAMIVFGAEHFIDAGSIAALTPAWMRAQLVLAASPEPDLARAAPQLP